MLAVTLEDRLEDQKDLVRAFEAGEVAGVERPVQRIDTALSHVFLSGRHAYKLKRAIRLPFVDFRTARQRRMACEAELTINRRFGSPLYRCVAGVMKAGSGYKLTQADAALDWVVVMDRFADSQRFDALAQEGGLAVEQAERAAELIADIHRSAEPVWTAGHAADYRRIIHELRQAEEAAAAARDLSAGDERLYLKLDAELARVDPLIEERRVNGKVRRGHGDLHLSNLCLHDGVPALFDALEFDERMATTDTLYDLAFFLMDLRHFGLDRQANAAMNHYWNVAVESESSLALLPFFMALRASVRMAVAVAAGNFGEADRYRKLGLRLLSRSPPAIVALGGLSGSGKSRVAREIAHALPGAAGARVVRSDVLRKRAFGVGLNEAIANDGYTPARRAEVYRDVMCHGRSAAKAGASVIVDATFERPDACETLEAVLPSARKIWLDAPLACRLERVRSRRGDASDADADVVRSQAAPCRLRPAWQRVSATGALAEVAAEVLECLT